MKKRDFGLAREPPVLRRARRRRRRGRPGSAGRGRASRSPIALYYVRMFGVTGGYHRYFSHRTYRTSRVVPVRARGPRADERRRRACSGGRRITAITTSYSDTPGDVHSCARRRLLVEPRRLDPLDEDRGDRHTSKIKDLAQLPGAPLARTSGTSCRRSRSASASGSSAAGGRSSGASSSRRRCSGTARSRSTRSRTCSASAATRRRTTAGTTSILALVTMGEGWHNNHHYYQRSVRQGFFWWEIDLTYYVLRALAPSASSGTSTFRRRRSSPAISRFAARSRSPRSLLRPSRTLRRSSRTRASSRTVAAVARRRGVVPPIRCTRCAGGRASKSSKFVRCEVTKVRR